MHGLQELNFHELWNKVKATLGFDSQTLREGPQSQEHANDISQARDYVPVLQEKLQNVVDAQAAVVPGLSTAHQLDKGDYLGAATDGAIDAAGGKVLGMLGGVIKKAGGTKMVTVFTATDGPVDLNRAASESSSGGVGGTFVTEIDITDPLNLARHTRQNIPFSFSRDGQIPSTISTIEVPVSALKVDPSVPNPTSGTFWIPPNSNGARVVNQHKVIGEDSKGLPIIKKQ